MSRTKKKAYTKSKRFDKTCRNHGSCSYCYSNRMHKVLKKIYPIEPEIEKYYDMSILDECNNIYEVLDKLGFTKVDSEELKELRNPAYKYLIP